ncbi:MAG: TOBE domain-containing protein [Anaerolineae bacterium]|nr:TOBE domain-containing protein [Anaerolineae bacterium]NIN97022.1 TOBE domain-containing protein [Anaerolineae bacterium]
MIVPPELGEKASGKGRVIMGIRPEDISIGDGGAEGEIYVVEPLGRDDLIDVHIGESDVHVLADPAMGLKMGESISLGFNAEKVQFFDRDTEQSLLWQ